MAWCDTCKNSVSQSDALSEAIADIEVNENLSDEEKAEAKEAIKLAFEDLSNEYAEVRYCQVNKSFVVRGDKPTQIVDMSKECENYAEAE